MDDQACDIRDQYIEGLATGTEEAVLVREMLEAIGQDVDDYPVGILALAATQWKYGRLSAQVKEKAFEVIDSGADLVRWENSDLSRRRAVLTALRKKLESPQPRQTLPRRQSDIPLTIATEKVSSPDGTAAAYVWKSIKPHPNAPVFCQACIEYSDGGGSGLVSAYCQMEEVKLEWTNSERLMITIPAGSESTRKAGWPIDSDVYRMKRGGIEREVVLRFAPSSLNGR